MSNFDNNPFADQDINNPFQRSGGRVLRGVLHGDKAGGTRSWRKEEERSSERDGECEVVDESEKQRFVLNAVGDGNPVELLLDRGHVDDGGRDPSVAQARHTVPPPLEEYNPFTDGKVGPAGVAARTAASTFNTQPAIMKATEEPPAYSQEQPQGASELLKRQEELERKAAELDRREREMQSLNAAGGRRNNWPPLPENLPVGPCFYHDITVDIPVEFQKTVKIMYYLWMFHAGTLFANVVGCLAWFCVDSGRGGDFGLSILWLLMFTPCSFVCWYRPLYGAFRSDSSFRFFIFFFVYVCQVGVYVLQSIGLSGWGTSGWISALKCLNTNIPVGILMILIAALFSSLAVMSLIMFKKVHAMYRTTGASFEKAQQEFATGVMTNKNVQTATAKAASQAAQEAFREQV